MRKQLIPYKPTVVASNISNNSLAAEEPISTQDNKDEEGTNAIEGVVQSPNKCHICCFVD